MGEGNKPFLNISINAAEDVKTAKAAVAAGIPVAVEGANVAVATLAAASSVGDKAGAQAAIASLTEYVEQLQSLGDSQKAADEYGSKAEVQVDKSKSKV